MHEILVRWSPSTLRGRGYQPNLCIGSLLLPQQEVQIHHSITSDQNVSHVCFWATTTTPSSLGNLLYTTLLVGTPSPDGIGRGSPDTSLISARQAQPKGRTAPSSQGALQRISTSWVRYTGYTPRDRVEYRLYILDT